MIPRARTEQIVICQMPDELLLYEVDRQRLHFLNRTATLVWQHCDGKTAVPEIARVLHSRLHLPADEDLVWLSLDCLSRANLLDAPVTLEAPGRCCRREVQRRLGLYGALAALLPAATMLAARTEATVTDRCR